MHNLVFESQDEWSSASGSARTDLFAGYAQQIGLNKSEFVTSFNDDSAIVNKKINFDQALGRKLGVNSTPTFFLNGKKLTSESFNGADAFEKTLLAEFKKQGVSVPADSSKKN
jgi:protein-disulfide isomerase